MQPKNPRCEILATRLDKISFSTFCDFSHQLFSEISIEVLVHGNWAEEDALNINQQITDAFEGQYNKGSNIKIPVTDIKNSGELILPLILPDHDHATVLYYPQEEKDVLSIAKTMVTAHLLSPLFFSGNAHRKTIWLPGGSGLCTN